MKLIIINGTSGVGKSTLAKRLHSRLNFSYLLDVDQLRYNLSDVKEYRDESRNFSFNLALKTAEFCLQNNVDIVLDKLMYEDDSKNYNYVDSFIDLGKKNQAEIIEIILHADKDTILNRLNERGYPIEETNTPEIASGHWDKFEKYRRSRRDAILIDVSNLSPEEVFNQVLDKTSL